MIVCCGGLRAAVGPLYWLGVGFFCFIRCSTLLPLLLLLLLLLLLRALQTPALLRSSLLPRWGPLTSSSRSPTPSSRPLITLSCERHLLRSRSTQTAHKPCSSSGSSSRSGSSSSRSGSSSSGSGGPAALLRVADAAAAVLP